MGKEDAVVKPRQPLGMPTRAQLPVLLLMLSGLESKDIARKLGLSERTVKQHRSNMMLRTGCLTSGQLCYWAAINGYRPARAYQQPVSDVQPMSEHAA